MKTAKPNKFSNFSVFVRQVSTVMLRYKSCSLKKFYSVLPACMVEQDFLRFICLLEIVVIGNSRQGLFMKVCNLKNDHRRKKNHKIINIIITDIVDVSRYIFKIYKKLL